VYSANSAVKKKGHLISKKKNKKKHYLYQNGNEIDLNDKKFTKRKNKTKKKRKPPRPA